MNALRAHRTLKTPYEYTNRFLYILLPCVTSHSLATIISALRRFKRLKVNRLLKHGYFGEFFSFLTPCNNYSMSTFGRYVLQSPKAQRTNGPAYPAIKLYDLNILMISRNGLHVWRLLSRIRICVSSTMTYTSCSNM